MAEIDDLISHYRKERDLMVADVESFETGQMALFNQTPSGRVDITAKWVADLKDRIANMNRVIAAYEKHKFG